MKSTLVKELMSANPCVIEPNATLQQAAQKMAQINCGILPVGMNDTPEGIITDRDITIRAVASGKDVSQEKVGDYMTPRTHYCNESDTLEQAAELMHKYQVNRLLVHDVHGNLSGILSFGCILRKDNNPKEIENVVEVAVGRKAA